MLVEVRRAYGGQEGKRLRPGDKFWVVQPGGKAKPSEPVVAVISLTRFKQLEQQRLVAKPNGEPDAKVEPASRPAQPAPRRVRAAPGAKVEPDSKPRTDSKAKEPRPAVAAKSRPGGQKDGTGRPSSSSPAAHQTGASTLKQRGTRRGDKPSAGSSSTTHGNSSPGPTSSTPATLDGGGTTPASGDSAAFD